MGGMFCVVWFGFFGCCCSFGWLVCLFVVVVVVFGLGFFAPTLCVLCKVVSLLFKFGLIFSRWCTIFLYHFCNCHMCLIQLESVTWKFLVNGRCFEGMRSALKGREGLASQAAESTLVVVL